jgi:hypothetical protein
MMSENDEKNRAPLETARLFNFVCQYVTELTDGKDIHEVPPPPRREVYQLHIYHMLDFGLRGLARMFICWNETMSRFVRCRARRAIRYPLKYSPCQRARQMR